LIALHHRLDGDVNIPQTRQVTVIVVVAGARVCGGEALQLFHKQGLAFLNAHSLEGAGAAVGSFNAGFAS
jgi:1,4-dihydroxy-2-naphthoyl-CoA synthase